MGSLPLPRNLVAAAERGGWQHWLATLPAIVGELEQRWSVRAGDPFQPGGRAAWVAPARGTGGTELVLKVGWPHPESAGEAEGLLAWDGDGTVRLHAALELDGSTAMLLERCAPGTPLSSRPEPEQDVVVAGLLRRLWREPGPQHALRPLERMCDEWADEFERAAGGGDAGLDPGLARDGITLLRSLPRSADRHVLLCTDLHAGNVLAAEREPWLVIDPKPHVGDPTYDAVQHLLNCPARLRTCPLELSRRVADLCGLDAERLRAWLFARCVQESPDWSGLAEVARRVAPA